MEGKTLQQLRDMLESGEIDKETLIWTEELDEWMGVRAVDGPPSHPPTPPHPSIVRPSAEPGY